LKVPKSIEELPTKELKELLEEKKNMYKDTEDEMKFVLGQTGIHLPGNTKEKYNRELKSIQEEIDEIKEELERRG